MRKFARNLSSAFLFFLSYSLQAQDLTGIWRGYFITDDGDQYKYEVQLKQGKKNLLSGVTYSYLDTRFYGKTTLAGNYSPSTKSALVQEVKTIELRMDGGSAACIMKCRLVYARSGREEFLEGVYTSAYEKTNPLLGITRGGTCGDGKVYLRKVTTSDFYIEPFLRNHKAATAPKNNVTGKPVQPQKPAAKHPSPKHPAEKKPAPEKSPAQNKPDEKPAIVQPEVTKPDVPAKPVVPKIIPAPAIIRDRKNELIRTITVRNKTVEISLYDNGEIDDDSVSIYLNGTLLLANKRLSNKPIQYTLHLDESQPEQTLIMVAENMGRIPPNTSLMLVQDGDRRHQVSITSTETKNAMVRFRYDPESP